VICETAAGVGSSGDAGSTVGKEYGLRFGKDEDGRQTDEEGLKGGGEETVDNMNEGNKRTEDMSVWGRARVAGGQASGARPGTMRKRLKVRVTTSS